MSGPEATLEEAARRWASGTSGSVALSPADAQAMAEWVRLFGPRPPPSDRHQDYDLTAAEVTILNLRSEAEVAAVMPRIRRIAAAAATDPPRQ